MSKKRKAVAFEANPEAVKQVKASHIRTLQRRLHHLEGWRAMGETNDWDHAEIAALRVAVAELTEVFKTRHGKDSTMKLREWKQGEDPILPPGDEEDYAEDAVPLTPLPRFKAAQDQQ